MADLGNIGRGTALGSLAAGQNSYAANTGQPVKAVLGAQAVGQNSYAANTGQVVGRALGNWAVNLTNPYLRKPNRGYISFTLKDVAGGVAIVGARCFIFERNSMVALPQIMSSNGPTPRVSDSNGFVKFSNLETASDVYYLAVALHPVTGFNAARFDFVQATVEP